MTMHNKKPGIAPKSSHNQVLKTQASPYKETAFPDPNARLLDQETTTDKGVHSQGVFDGSAAKDIYLDIFFNDFGKDGAHAPSDSESGSVFGKVKSRLRTGQDVLRSPETLDEKAPNTTIDHIPLNLNAQDLDDLEIISSLCQDAIIPGTDFSYDKQNRTFLMRLNRFCVETRPDMVNGKPIFKRVLSALKLSHIDRVQMQNFDQSDKSVYYNLMGIVAHSSLLHNLMSNPSDADLGASLDAGLDTNNVESASASTTYIDLIFSGEAKLRLTASDISLVLMDSTDYAYTDRLPMHADRQVKQYDINEKILQELEINQT